MSTTATPTHLDHLLSNLSQIMNNLAGRGLTDNQIKAAVLAHIDNQIQTAIASHPGHAG